MLNNIYFIKENALFVFRGLSPIDFANVLSILIVVNTRYYIVKQTDTHPNDFIEI